MGGGGASLGIGQLEGWGVGRNSLNGAPAGAAGGQRPGPDDSEEERLSLRDAGEWDAQMPGSNDQRGRRDHARDPAAALADTHMPSLLRSPSPQSPRHHWTSDTFIYL